MRVIRLPLTISGRLPRTPRQNYRIVIMVFFFFMGINFASWATRIPDIKTALSLSDGALGGILFGAPLGELVAIAPAAWMINRFRTRKTILISITLLPITLLSLSLAPSIAMLFTCLFFFGFVYNMLNIALNAQAVGIEILYRRSIIASFHGMWSLGGVVGGVLGAFLAPLGVSTFIHFCGILCLTFIAILAFRPLIMPREVRIGPVKVQQGNVHFRPNTFLVLVGLIAFGSMATEGAMYDWSAVYFSQEVQPAEYLVRLGYLACMSAMVIGRLVADKLVNRYGVTLVLQMSGLCIACGFSLALIFPQLLTATLGFALVGFGMASIVPLCYSLAGRSTTIPAQMGIAFVSSISFFGFLACPPMVGFLSHLLNLRLALSPIIFAGLAIFILAPLAQRLRS